MRNYLNTTTLSDPLSLKFFPVQENNAPQPPKNICDRVRLASIAQGTRFLANTAPQGIISNEIKRLIVSVVNVFETGCKDGDYSCVSVYEDGPKGASGHATKQLTYGRTQTTEYGLLPVLLDAYIRANGEFSAIIKSKYPLLKTGVLAQDKDFISTLQKAGNDPVMREVQDDFFDRMYWVPAFRWWMTHEFKTALSMLVVYNSFVQSGGILDFLRRRFDESVPSSGGDEKTWIRNYVSTRDRWLKNHANIILRRTAYRTACLLSEISKNNWDLSLLPIQANGVNVS